MRDDRHEAADDLRDDRTVARPDRSSSSVSRCVTNTTLPGARQRDIVRATASARTLSTLPSGCVTYEWLSVGRAYCAACRVDVVVEVRAGHPGDAARRVHRALHFDDAAELRQVNRVAVLADRSCRGGRGVTHARALSRHRRGPGDPVGDRRRCRRLAAAVSPPRADDITSLSRSLFVSSVYVPVSDFARDDDAARPSPVGLSSRMSTLSYGSRSTLARRRRLNDSRRGDVRRPRAEQIARVERHALGDGEPPPSRDRGRRAISASRSDARSSRPPASSTRSRSVIPSRYAYRPGRRTAPVMTTYSARELGRRRRRESRRPRCSAMSSTGRPVLSRNAGAKLHARRVGGAEARTSTWPRYASGLRPPARRSASDRRMPGVKPTAPGVPTLPRTVTLPPDAIAHAKHANHVARLERKRRARSRDRAASASRR